MSRSDGVSDRRGELLAEYRQLVDVELPARARAEGWVVSADHCFGRILLDHAVGRCWYEVLDRRRSAGPAFRQLSDEQLTAAVELARDIRRAGDPLLRDLNDRSLRWRGKSPRRDAGP